MTDGGPTHELDLLVRLPSGRVIRLGELGPQTLLALDLDEQTPAAQNVLAAILEGYRIAQLPADAGASSTVDDGNACCQGF